MTDNAAAAAAELLELTSSDSPYGSLSGFTIDKKIGKGQFSVVYRARAITDERTVALKKVQIFEMMDSKARLDCMKEIQLLQQLNHPNVIKLLDLWFVRQKHALIFEFAGKSFRSLANSWLFSRAQLQGIMVQLVGALAPDELIECRC